MAKVLVNDGLTPKLTGAGARSAQGTTMGHQNREAMAHGGVRVERRVRPRCLREAPVPKLGDGVTTSRAMACANGRTAFHKCSQVFCFGADQAAHRMTPA